MRLPKFTARQKFLLNALILLNLILLIAVGGYFVSKNEATLAVQRSTSNAFVAYTLTNVPTSIQIPTHFLIVTSTPLATSTAYPTVTPFATFTHEQAQGLPPDVADIAFNKAFFADEYGGKFIIKDSLKVTGYQTVDPLLQLAFRLPQNAHDAVCIDYTYTAREITGKYQYGIRNAMLIWWEGSFGFYKQIEIPYQPESGCADVEK